MRRAVVIATALVFVLCTCLLAQDWPQFRGPYANGFSGEKGLNKSWSSKKPRLLWQVKMSDGGYAGPSAAGGKVFIIDHIGAKDCVRALDINTGKQLWQYQYDDPAGNNYGFSRSTPVVSGGKVYTAGRMGIVLCLNAASGKLLWWKNVLKDFRGGKPTWDYAWSPVVDGNKLLVCPGGGASLVALDKNTGKKIWSTPGGEAANYCTPVIGKINGRAQYVFFTQKNLVGVDAGSGKLVWSFKWESGYDVNAASPIILGDYVFITSGYNHGCAMLLVKGSRAKAVWQNTSMQAHFNTPIYYNGYIYGTTDMGGALICMDARTGKVMWQRSGFEKGGVAAVDGAVIAVDGAGGAHVAVALNSSAYKELGRFTPLGGQSWTAPIVANGKLITRNTSTLACYSLK